MKYKFIVCDAGKCVGCHICELACSATKEGCFNPLLSRIHVAHLESTSEAVSSIAFACYLCEDPACVKSCPRKALSIDKENGTVVVNEGYSGCSGCGWCMTACEFGAPSLHLERRVAFICDLCPEEKEPPCVSYCPKEALSLATIEEAVEKSETEAAKKLLRELSRARDDSETFYKRFGFNPIQIE